MLTNVVNIYNLIILDIEVLHLVGKTVINSQPS